MEPRKSTETTETDRRHLLDSSAASIAPSDSVSVITANHDGDATPRARSPARESTTTTSSSSSSQPYRGFPSEEAYLAALQAWADGQKFTSFDTSLIGYYGTRTAEEIASQPRPDFGLRKKWRERRERKNSEAQVQGADGGVGQRREQRRGTVG